MRAANTVVGLARACNLTVAVVPVSDPGAARADLGWAAERAEDCVLAPLPEPADAVKGWLSDPAGLAVAAAAEPLPDRAKLACPGVVPRETGAAAFDLVWTLRLYLAGAALPYRDRGARLVLDIDEDDAATLGAIAELHRARGEAEAAARLAADAEAYARLAAQCLGRFDLVVTASKGESEATRRRHGLTEVATIANAVPRPAGPRRAKDTGAASLLFLGNMDYLPNFDAAERLIGEIFLAVRQSLPEARLHIAGGGARGSDLAAGDGVRLHGFVPDLTPLYAQADLVVVPLRAGGGSRLKILEAFAHQVPVVATPEAAAGLAVGHERELLIVAEADMADAVARLLGDPRSASGLVHRAKAFVDAQHDIDRIAEDLARLALSNP